MAGKCTSSQWSITVNSKAHAHQYDIEISSGRPVDEANTKAPRMLSKSNNSYHKKLCRDILAAMGFLSDNTFVYDGRAQLWTAKALKSDINITMFHAELNETLRSALPDPEAVLKVTATKVKSIKLDAFGQGANGSVHEDRTWRNIMELILTEDPITRRNNAFIAVGSGELFEATAVPFDRGLVLRNGNRKGVHIVKGKNGAELCLSLDCTKKVFFPNNVTFLQLVRNFMAGGRDFAEAETLFRGIKLQPSYNRGRVLNFKKFTDQTVAQLTTDDGTTLNAYFFSNLNVNLEYLNERAATMSNGKGEFPLEVLEVVPNQPVPVVRMPDSLREKTLELNRLKPHERHNAIKDEFAKLNLNNNITAAFGIHVNPKMTEGDFQQLPPLNMILRNNVTVTTDEVGSFRYRNGYYKPAEFETFIVLSNRRDSSKSLACARALADAASRKGMRLATPVLKDFNTSSQRLNDWVNALTPYKGRKALVLTVDGDTTNHAILKLAEALTGVQTQHMLFITALKATPTEVSKGRPITLENIVHKLNIKAGGLNHAVDFGRNLNKLKLNSTLIVAVDVAHPTGEDYKGETDEPSVVGLVGNYLKSPYEFAGTYALQNPRQETVDGTVLRLAVRQMLQEASKHRVIDTIVFLRDGVSEGQYATVLDEEIPAVQSAATDLSIKLRVLAIVVTKNGNARHFIITRSRVESMPPRSFISFGTRNNFTQFYMTAHRAFAGTAKTVMITVIRDDLDLSASEVQSFLLGLAHLHQIVSAPVSLPAPVYQADALAERGQKLFRALKKHSESRIPHATDGGIDYVKLTNILSFSDGNMPLTRYTA